MELKNMYNNVEKFVLAGVILCIGSLFFLMDQSEEVELSDNISESFFDEGTVDVEITSLVNNTNMGNSVNDEAMATETVPTFHNNVESLEVIETTPVPSFNVAFLAARNELGPGNTFEWNGNLYSTNYADEVFEVLDTEVAVEEILIDETEPQLSQVENDESLAYNIQ
ncbi:MAG: hypothetical protein O3A49_03510 [Candidatus Marinimicrobia bacterium]|nr:hypothetical protein [Candidatus Neomarinimicrobiota bacterium]MDA0753726.1 hypothetical protein [Candidatus Neomarinimicrobiota bacterium]MDA1363757.1 hypothetical protein [Candidatus Neomarinimicrobiota bacterium]